MHLNIKLLLFYLSFILIGSVYSQINTHASEIESELNIEAPANYKKEIAQRASIPDSLVEPFFTYLKPLINNDSWSFGLKQLQPTFNKDSLNKYYEFYKLKYIKLYDTFLSLRRDKKRGMYLNNKHEHTIDFNHSTPVSSFSNKNKNPTPQIINGPCTNIDFETGDLSGWSGTYSLPKNQSDIPFYYDASGSPWFLTSPNTPTDPYVNTGFNTGPSNNNNRITFTPNLTYSNQKIGQHTIMTAGAGNDPLLSSMGVNLPRVYPGGGSTSVRLGNDSSLNSAESITQTFLVTSANEIFTYHYAVVILEGTGHTNIIQPRFRVKMFDGNGNEIPCAAFDVNANTAASSGLLQKLHTYPSAVTPGLTFTLTFWYNDWKSVTVPLTAYKGQNVRIEFSTADCGHVTIDNSAFPTLYGGGAHFAYAYIDADCNPLVLTATEQTCPSDNVTLTAPPGFANYTWNGPGIVGPNNTPSIQVNANGNYQTTMTVIGNTSCTGIIDTVLSVTLLQPLTGTAGATAAGCGTGGSVNISAVSGGNTGGYSYSWNTPGGSTAQTVSNLPAGTYTITITDSKGCTSTSSTTVTSTSGSTATMSAPGNPTCAGNNGTATVNVTGVATSYTYSWSTGAPATTSTTTTNSISGLGAGIYSVTVTDNNGCSSVTSVTLTSPASFTLSVGNTPTTCGQSNGSATATPTGGTGITYTWNNGFTSQTISTLASATYTVTVNDGGGCPIISTVSIAASTSPTATGSSSTIACGATNGTASVTTSGTTGVVSYLWDSGALGATAQTVNSLSAGSYQVTITDGAGCTATTTSSINNTGGVTATMGVPTPILCFGNQTSSVTVTATGGTGLLTYEWTGGVSSSTTATTNTRTGLGAGSYTVTITDVNGCKNTSNVVITQLPKLNVTASGLSTKCNAACDGQAIVIPSGGTGANSYVFSWTGPTGAITGNTPSISALCIGSYSIRVTDANGCTKDTTVSVSQPSAISLVSSNTPSGCNQTTGSVSVNATGGTTNAGVYTYLWTNGATSQTVNSLGAATYTVTVSDLNNCNVTTTAIVINTNGVNASIQGSPSNVTCFSACNGSATVTGTGGTTPYTYAWPSGATTASLNALCQGAYIVTVRDGGNCSSTVSINITQPLAISIPTITSQTVCIGQSATITVNPSGGNPNYTYIWSGTTSTSNSITTNINSATTFTVTVTDASNCTPVTATASVNTTAALNITASNDTAICNNGTVNLKASATGGLPNYIYTWLTSPQQNGSSITLNPTTTQTVQVVVNDGCGTPADTTDVIVTLNAEPTVNFTADVTEGCPVLCVNFQDNSTVTGGTITQWEWNFKDSISNIQAGSYCFKTSGSKTVILKVTSDKGCSKTDSVVNMINVYPTPNASFLIDPVKTTILAPTVNFTNQSTGANQWLWDFGDPNDNSTSAVQNPPAHTYDDIGTYCTLLTVRNNQGCIDTAQKCVVVEAEFAFWVPNAFSPNDDGVNDSFNGKGIGIKKYKMLIFDRWGALIFQSDNINTNWDGKANYGNEMAQQDVYVYKIVVTSVFDKVYNYIGHVTLVK